MLFGTFNKTMDSLEIWMVVHQRRTVNLSLPEYKKTYSYDSAFIKKRRVKRETNSNIKASISTSRVFLKNVSQCLSNRESSHVFINVKQVFVKVHCNS